MSAKFNQGRFLFLFDPITRGLSSILDTKYGCYACYNLNHPGFKEVFEIAVKSLDDEAVVELKEQLKDDSEFLKRIDKFND